MKRRSFLKLLSAFVAVAAVDPVVVLKAAEPAPIQALATGPVLEGFAVYDLLPPSRMIYPVMSPFRNQLRRVA